MTERFSYQDRTTMSDRDRENYRNKAALLAGVPSGIYGGYSFGELLGGRSGSKVTSYATDITDNIIDEIPLIEKNRPSKVLSFLTNPLNPKKGEKELVDNLKLSFLENARYYNKRYPTTFASRVSSDYVKKIRPKIYRNAVIISGLVTGLATAPFGYASAAYATRKTNLRKKWDKFTGKRKTRKDKGQKRLITAAIGAGLLGVGAYSLLKNRRKPGVVPYSNKNT
jgi:hypothetical protein